MKLLIVPDMEIRHYLSGRAPAPAHAKLLTQLFPGAAYFVPAVRPGIITRLRRRGDVITVPLPNCLLRRGRLGAGLERITVAGINAINKYDYILWISPGPEYIPRPGWVSCDRNDINFLAAKYLHLFLLLKKNPACLRLMLKTEDQLLILRELISNSQQRNFILISGDEPQIAGDMRNRLQDSLWQNRIAGLYCPDVHALGSGLVCSPDELAVRIMGTLKKS